MDKPVKERDFVPNRIIVCPGGAEADFLYKRGGYLYWRGRLPLGERGKWHRYVLITGLDYEEIETRDVDFERMASYREDADPLLRS
jgi:hypothetical protein